MNLINIIKLMKITFKSVFRDLLIARDKIVHIPETVLINSDDEKQYIKLIIKICALFYY